MDWIALVFSITGLWFNGRKSMWCWPCWFFSNAAWCTYAVATHQPSLIILQVLFFIFNVIGYRAWKRDAAKKSWRPGIDPCPDEAWNATRAYAEFYGMDPKKRKAYLEGRNENFQSRDRTRRDKYGNPR